MKKILLIITTLTVVIGSFAWVMRIEILLAMVKYRFSSIEVADQRELHWQQGPLENFIGAGQRPANII
ncbi:MAG TPA: sulfatase, partial [Porticoccaceae bacterium]|nr:sulfatase [Porticoccaceae bacterium]